jgi:hypothetical protein
VLACGVHSRCTDDGNHHDAQRPGDQAYDGSLTAIASGQSLGVETV